MKGTANEVTTANAGWRLLFRFAVHGLAPGVAEFYRSAMKAHLSILALCVTSVVLHPSITTCAVIHVVEPQPLELTLGTGVGVDMDQDGTTDLLVRYYGMPVCIGSPEGGSYLCSLGVTLEFGSQLHLLGSPSSLDPVALLPGQIVGPTPTDGVWLETFPSPISLIFEYGTVSYARQGYPEYTQDLDHMAIGFRLAEQESFYYGYIDVSLATWMPHIEGIVLGDTPNASLSVVQVPEPSAFVLAVLMAAVGWRHGRRRR